MASQLVLYASHVVPVAVLWLAIVLEWLPLLQYGPDCFCFRHFVVFVRAPIYSVMCLGIYALFSVCYGVATFNDCAQARSELIQEIKEARADLKKRSIIS